MQLNDENFESNYSSWLSFGENISKYFPGAVFCGAFDQWKNIKGCYKAQEGKQDKLIRNYSDTDIAKQNFWDDGIYLLRDGTIIMFETLNNKKYLSMDINGYTKGPNRWGWDVFTWQYLNGEFKAMGSVGTDYSSDYCSETSTDRYNGIGCTTLAKTDPDYFKKLK